MYYTLYKEYIKEEIHMKDLVNIIICFFFMAIPEFIFMSILLIKFMGRKELLDTYRLRENIKWYMVLVIPPSLLMSILLYGFKLQQNIASLISLLFLYLLSIYVFEKTKTEEVSYIIVKIFIRFIPLYLSLIAIDLLTAPILFFILHLNYEEISKNISLVFICSIPSKIIELVIITFIITYKQRKYQINLLEYIYKNIFFKRFVVVTLILLLIFEISVLILFDNLLNSIHSLIGQMILVICTTYLIPSIVITGLYLIINYCVSLLNSGKQTNNQSSIEG